MKSCAACAVVFIADSRRAFHKDNVAAFENMKVNLLANRLVPERVPLVFQYNKQDLPRDLILTLPELSDALNFRAVPEFSADALHGPGVFETLRGISELVLKRLAVGSPVA